MLRRWLLRNEYYVGLLVLWFFMMMLVGVVASEFYWTLFFGGAGLGLCLVMLTVLLTEARGGEN